MEQLAVQVSKFSIHYDTKLEAEQSLVQLKEQILKHKPVRVVGMGEYSGVDMRQIRIEQIAKNKFRNAQISDLGPDSLELTIPFTLSAETTPGFKLGSGLGNSWCNLSAYQLAWFISNQGLDTKLSFLHIPKIYPIEFAVADIERNLFSQDWGK